MDDPIAMRSAEYAPTAEERELGARIREHVRAHHSDFEEARRWEREEHCLPALPHAKREPWSDESADFVRMNSMRVAVLSEQSRQALHARGIGFAPLDSADQELRARWALRTVYVYWLLVDPASEWSGGAYRQEELMRDRASAWRFMAMCAPMERRLLVESVLKALDVLDAPGNSKGAGPLTKNENAVLRLLHSLKCDASGHPGAMKGPAICHALSKHGISVGDDELRRLMAELRKRGLVDSRRGRGYWATELPPEQPT